MALVNLKPGPMIARDLLGYGEFPPDPKWPSGAKIAVNFHLHFETGGGVAMANGAPVQKECPMTLASARNREYGARWSNRYSNTVADVVSGASLTFSATSKSISASSA